MSNYYEKWKGIVFALLAAALFGASTPLAKLLLPKVEPMLMAGLLYLASGIGLGVFWVLPARHPVFAGKERSLGKKDLPWLAGAIAAGGIIGPFLLLSGLAATPASTAALLLNLESVLTALLAWFVFKENCGSRVLLGMALIAAGGVLLSYQGRPAMGMPWGMLAIIGACLSWAIDNNLTRKISLGNPVQIAACKGLTAGTFNIVLSLLLGASMPGPWLLLATGIVGLLGYGISLVLFVLALRHLGAARTGAYFAIAPWVGVGLSILVLRENFTLGFGIAAVLMGVGVWLHMTEHHEHKHKHALLEHEHVHSHDAHHQHIHGVDAPAGKTHSHPHQHEELTHTHPHFPDAHHQHGH